MNACLILPRYIMQLLNFSIILLREGYFAWIMTIISQSYK